MNLVETILDRRKSKIKVIGWKIKPNYYFLSFTKLAVQKIQKKKLHSIDREREREEKKERKKREKTRQEKKGRLVFTTVYVSKHLLDGGGTF